MQRITQFLLLPILCFLTVSLHAAQLKTAVVDGEYIVTKIGERYGAPLLDKKLQPEQDNIIQLEKQIAQLHHKAERERETMSQQQRGEVENQIKRLKAQHDIDSKRLRTTYNDLVADMRGKITKVLKAAIEQYGQRKGYDYVFFKHTLAYYKPQTSDITNHIYQLVEQQFK